MPSTPTKKAVKSKTSTGPSTLELIKKAVTALKEPKGSSGSAIKKQLAAGGVDIQKKNTIINREAKKAPSKPKKPAAKKPKKTVEKPAKKAATKSVAKKVTKKMVAKK